MGVNNDLTPPQWFKLTVPFPNQPPFTEKKKNPTNLRFHKLS